MKTDLFLCFFERNPGFQSMGQILGMLSLNFFADRFGRKKALYLLWIVLVGVRSSSSPSVGSYPFAHSFLLPFNYRVSSLKPLLQLGGPGLSRSFWQVSSRRRVSSISFETHELSPPFS